jgi:uncharacterized protein (DUF983 family)
MARAERDTGRRPDHVLMLRGTVALCPDCGDERVLLPVDGTEFCCTDCDAAVLLLDDRVQVALVSRLAS